MTEFWVASGHHLTRRDAAGFLAVTDELLAAYLARPEVLPPPEACDAERRLHGRLLTDPRAPVPKAEIDALADPDARENWTHLLAYRDLLAAAGSVEAAWLGLVRARRFAPQIFLNHMAQLCLRNALDGCDDPFTLRAAELLFRPQSAKVRDGVLHLADLEMIEAIDEARRRQPLTAMLEPDAWAGLDVMTPETAWTWWSRSDAHSMALNWGGDPRSRAGLAAAMASFLRHMLGVETLIEPVGAIETRLRWYVGLDEGGTRLGDALWRGDAADEAAKHLVGLFRLTFLRSSQARAGLGDAPVWLMMTVARDGTVRLKPQNLLTGLPIADAA